MEVLLLKKAKLGINYWGIVEEEKVVLMEVVEVVVVGVVGIE